MERTESLFDIWWEHHVQTDPLLCGSRKVSKALFMAGADAGMADIKEELRRSEGNKRKDDDDRLLVIDDQEDALMGVCSTWSNHSHVRRLVYSGPRMVETYVERDGMTEEDAEEWIDFNIEGAYMGEHTPIVMWDYHDEEC